MLGPGGGGGGGGGELVVVHDLEAWRAGSRELSFMRSVVDMNQTGLGILSWGFKN
jgi:hypothetical protein